MKKRLIALGSYAVFWLLFFTAARLIFLISQYKLTFTNGAGEIISTFVHGIKLDISTTGYYLLLPVLVAIPSLFFNFNWYRHFIKWYTFLLIVFSVLVVVADTYLYSYWGFRMDYTPIFYLKTPGEAMASLSTFKVILFFILVIILSSLFIYLYNRLIDKFFTGITAVSLKILWVFSLLLLWGLLIIPIRGGFGVAPINSGAGYFSKKMFLNHATINVIWNVGTTAFSSKPVKNPYEFGNQAEGKVLIDSLTVRRGEPRQILNNRKPNVLLIVLESFSGYLIGPLGGDSTVTPNLNRYAREGILFSEFYASGTRTDKAMPAILNGYPAQPAQSIIKEPKKSQSLPSIVKILIDKGYKSSFWYGGEINFANFNSFVVGSGFSTIVTKDNFNPGDYNSKWGVHDHVMFKMLKDSMENISEPFLNVVLTLSSHEPFDIPEAPEFAGKDEMTKYRSSVYYADEALGSFLDWAKTKEWWKNTLVILVADHCCRISEDMLIYSPNLFRIPMVWTGGALAEKGFSVNKIGGQTDIPVTLVGQLGIENNFYFGKDLFSDGSRPFAFYTFNEGFGYINDNARVAWDHKLKGFVLKEGSDTLVAEKTGKAYLQVLFNDYLKR